MADSSTVSIEEIPSTGKGRKILLVGPALPFQGASWGGQLGLVTTWYPGNGTEATQHVLGPREVPSSWEGIWRRTLMGKAPSSYTDENGSTTKVTAPVFLRDTLESIIRGGLLLLVTWTQIRASDGRKFEIVRTGRVASYEFPHDRIEDISWKMEFHWVGRGVRQQKAVALRDSDLEASYTQLDTFMNELAAKTEIDRIKTNKPGVKLGVEKLTLGQLEALAKAPNESLQSLTRSLQRNINKIRNAVDVANQFRKAPYDVANTATSAAKNNVAIANQYLDQWSRQPPESNTLKSNVADLTRSMRYLGESDESVRKIAAQSDQVNKQFKEQLSTTGANGQAQSVQATVQNRPGSILAVHIAKTGDTPIKLSLRYYGSPDNGLTILKANKLPPTALTFTPGKVLVIPALPNNPAVNGYTL